MAVMTSPPVVCQKRANGFSKKTTSPRKKAVVMEVTTITQGRNSRSRSQLRSVTSEAKADMSQDQKTSEPALPAPPGGDLQVGRHAPAGHLVHERHLEVIGDQQVDQDRRGQRDQRPKQQHGTPGRFHRAAERERWP